jgi:hypothetical protein
MSAQPKSQSVQERTDYIIRRLDEAVIKVTQFYSNRTDVQIDWNKQSPEQYTAFNTLKDAQNAYIMGILTENEVGKYFQKWVKTLEIAASIQVKTPKILRMVPQGLSA